MAGLSDFLPPRSPEAATHPQDGTRAEAAHRLQVGLSGLVAVVLLVAVASIVTDRADETDAVAVPEATAPLAADDLTPPQTDPLADAGVVPDMPAEPSPTPAPGEPVLPEQAGGAPAR